MKKNKIILILIIMTAVSFWTCHKKLLKHVQLHGKVVNYITGDAEPATITLYANASSRETKSRARAIGTSWVDINGNFGIKTNADYSNRYYLFIEPENSTGGEFQFDLVEGKDKDVGTFLAGKYTFYCKVTIVPSSANSIDFPYLETGTLHFNAGTSTQFLTKLTLRYNDYGKVFNLAYKVGSSTLSTISIPIINPTDTVTTTINY